MTFLPKLQNLIFIDTFYCYNLISKLVFSQIYCSKSTFSYFL